MLVQAIGYFAVRMGLLSCYPVHQDVHSTEVELDLGKGCTEHGDS